MCSKSAANDEKHTRGREQLHIILNFTLHYHLLVKTPEANLGRAMRHINGLYTQRYNRLKKTDGSLFRGRYKAICVEEDSYQLQLSRYIHRNPVEAGIVEQLESYPWSSYAYYVKKKKPPPWLYTQEILEQLHVKTRMREKYRAYVELGIDEEITKFYGKENQSPYLGSQSFRDWAYKQRDTDELSVSKETLQLFRPGLDEIIKNVMKEFKVSKESIIKSQRGRVTNNIPRWVSMYMAQQYGGLKLKKIADEFGLKRTGSIPTTIKKLIVVLDDDRKLLRKFNRIKSQYDT